MAIQHKIKTLITVSKKKKKRKEKKREKWMGNYDKLQNCIACKFQLVCKLQLKKH